MGDFLTRRPELGGLGDPAGIGQAFLQLNAKMIADPMSIAQAQLELCADHMKLWQRTTERLFDLTGKSDQRPAATDRRFQHPAWTENILFDYIKQSYVISAEAILSAVNRVNGLNPKTAHKGTSNNCDRSSGAPNLPANDSALFSFRFCAVHPKDVRDSQQRQLFEVPTR
jgi:hypothetical protein